MGIRELESEALRLPNRDRALLAEHLLLSLDDEEDVGSAQLWIEEAKARYAAYKAGSLSADSPDAVIGRVRKKLSP
jgi:putative addiction module component (TIGR02574 family)